jgi:hypothetical protein
MAASDRIVGKRLYGPRLVYDRVRLRRLLLGNAAGVSGCEGDLVAVRFFKL